MNGCCRRVRALYWPLGSRTAQFRVHPDTKVLAVRFASGNIQVHIDEPEIDILDSEEDSVLVLQIASVGSGPITPEGIYLCSFEAADNLHHLYEVARG